MNIAFKTHAVNPNKPEGMPNEWPWGTIVELGESTTPPDSSGDWLVMTKSAFEGYKALYRPAFLAYDEGVRSAVNLLNETKKQNRDKVDFATELMLRFKLKNIQEGISAGQAVWLHAKTRSLDVNFPGMPTVSIDLLNIALSGDVEAGCIALQYAVPDDMTQAYHWLSQERIDWLVSELKGFLGWP